MKKRHVLLTLILLAAMTLVSKTAFAASSETSADGLYTYEADHYAGTCTITGYTGSLENVVFPSSIDGLKVTAIDVKLGREDHPEQIKIDYQITKTDGKQLGEFKTFRPRHVGTVTVPEGVTSLKLDINQQITYDILSIDSISLPGSLKTLYIRSLGLKEITVPENVEELKLICYDTEKLTVKNGVKKLVSPSGYEYGSCIHMYSLKEVSLPKSVKELGSQAFAKCINLSSIDISNVEKIGDFAFADDIALTGVTFNEKKLELGSAFDGAGLISVTVPKNAVLSSSVFVNCHSLESASVKCSSESLIDTFANCDSLKEVYITGNVKTLSRTFSGCSALEKIIIPASVTEISYGSFSKEASMAIAFMNAGVNFNERILPVGIGNKAKILGYKGSTAETFAKNNGCKFIPFKTATSLKAKNSAKGKVSLSFKGVSGVKSYTIYRSTTKDSGYKKVGTTTSKKFTDKKAKKGKTYYYMVAVSYTDPETGLELSGVMSPAANVKVTK